MRYSRWMSTPVLRASCRRWVCGCCAGAVSTAPIRMQRVHGRYPVLWLPDDRVRAGDLQDPGDPADLQHGELQPGLRATTLPARDAHHLDRRGAQGDVAGERRHVLDDPGLRSGGQLGDELEAGGADPGRHDGGPAREPGWWVDQLPNRELARCDGRGRREPLPAPDLRAGADRRQVVPPSLLEWRARFDCPDSD